MRKITVPPQDFVDIIPIAIGKIQSCGLFREDDNRISRLLLGGEKGICSISKVPLNFNANDREVILSSVQYYYTSMPNHFVESINGKIVSAFMDSVFSTFNSKIIPIRNGLVL
jgi:hypothetical protein